MEPTVNKLRGKAFQVQEKYTKAGKRFVTFNLSYGEKQADGKFLYGSFKTAVFGDAGETLQLADRDYVEVSGFLSPHQWDNKEGKTVYENQIKATVVTRVGEQQELKPRDRDQVPF
jgi:hypothetical protein